MEETEIAAQLAAKAAEPTPPPVVETPEEPTETKPEPKEDEAFHDNLPLENTLDKLRLFDYFEIPPLSRRSAEVDTQLGRIMEWAQEEAGSREYTDILRVLNDQERIMGNRIKDNRLSRLYQFVTINAQRKRLAEQERALYA